TDRAIASPRFSHRNAERGELRLFLTIDFVKYTPRIGQGASQLGGGAGKIASQGRLDRLFKRAGRFLNLVCQKGQIAHSAVSCGLVCPTSPLGRSTQSGSTSGPTPGRPISNTRWHDLHASSVQPSMGSSHVSTRLTSPQVGQRRSSGLSVMVHLW